MPTLTRSAKQADTQRKVENERSRNADVPEELETKEDEEMLVLLPADLPTDIKKQFKALCTTLDATAVNDDSDLLNFTEASFVEKLEANIMSTKTLTEFMQFLRTVLKTQTGMQTRREHTVVKKEIHQKIDDYTKLMIIWFNKLNKTVKENPPNNTGTAKNVLRDMRILEDELVELWKNIRDYGIILYNNKILPMCIADAYFDILKTTFYYELQKILKDMNENIPLKFGSTPGYPSNPSPLPLYWKFLIGANYNTAHGKEFDIRDIFMRSAVCTYDTGSVFTLRLLLERGVNMKSYLHGYLGRSLTFQVMNCPTHYWSTIFPSLHMYRLLDMLVGAYTESKFNKSRVFHSHFNPKKEPRELDDKKFLSIQNIYENGCILYGYEKVPLVWLREEQLVFYDFSALDAMMKANRNNCFSDERRNNLKRCQKRQLEKHKISRKKK